MIRQFSGTAYTVELEAELDGDRLQKIEAIGAVVQAHTVIVRDPALLYHVLDILKPLPLVKVEKDRANLTDIFLTLTQAHPGLPPDLND